MHPTTHRAIVPLGPLLLGAMSAACDEDARDTAGCDFTCAACTEGTADAAAVVAGTSTLSVAFLRRHLLGDLSMEATLTEPRSPRA